MSGFDVMAVRLIREAKKLLEASGVDYEFVPTKKHIALFIEGRKVVVLSRGAHARKDLDTVKSAIRKHERARTP